MAPIQYRVVGFGLTLIEAADDAAAIAMAQKFLNGTQLQICHGERLVKTLLNHGQAFAPRCSTTEIPATDIAQMDSAASS
jgi:hypothetical protein